jgi:hypothetical protein
MILLPTRDLRRSGSCDEFYRLKKKADISPKNVQSQSNDFVQLEVWQTKKKENH